LSSSNVDSGHLQKTWQKGVRSLEQRDFVRAVGHFKKVVKAIPQDPDVHFALADALLGQGRADNAIREYRVGIDLSPGLAIGWIRLGGAFLMAAQGSKALEAFNQAKTIEPDSLRARAGAAEAAAMAGDLETAQAGFVSALALAPANPDLIISLARLQDAQGQTPKAEDTLRRACRDHPGETALWLALGRALQAWDRLEEAHALYQQARVTHPGAFELLAEFADTTYQMRDLDSARDLYRQLLQVEPKNPSVRNNLGQVLASLGDEADARQLFRDLIQDEPLFGEPWLNIARARHFTSIDDPDIRQMRSVLKRRQMNPSQTLYVHFALGKALDDCKDYDQAFFHYDKGNALRRRELQFDADEVERQFDRLIEWFSPELMERLSQKGSSKPQPLFIVGMPRSGTTLLEQVLCAHPDVGTAGELRDLARIARNVARSNEKPWPECIAGASSSSLKTMASEYLANLESRAPGSARVIDKMPQNFLHVGFAALLFPDATVVHCSRDPLDTCLSNYFQIFPGGIDFAYDLADLGQYCQGYQRLMSHWQTLLGERLVTVRYEELVSDPEPVLRTLLKAIGLPWSPACLSHQDSVQRVDTLSLYQVRQSLNTGSTKRWRNYEKHLGPLREALNEPRHVKLV
jgi:tetratricopeptide (TPR) repeat protein